MKEILKLQVTNHIASSMKSTASKKKEVIKLSEWVAKRLDRLYKSKASQEDDGIKVVEDLLYQLQIEA